ncbi:MAG: UDP-N-acetylmuramate--L-alanine ligase [Draconibacterium sp.]|nr:MAG: UDP-N-acetylmuramate--L-alanine ligase [Draconibacterium sp.]
MNNLQNIRNVYFLGIGGIGMSALARYFKFSGKNVAGYDKTPTKLTEAMQAEGIDIHFEDDIRNIPKSWDPATTMAVYTPALPDEHKELSWFREKPIALMKRAKVLGEIVNGKEGVAIAGTHGKTTISTMVATIMDKTKARCGAFLGGVSKNFGSNLLLPKINSPWVVVEADEFDRSFLYLKPALALVSSIDADHLDIYGTREKIVEAFEKFVSQIKPGGKLVVKKGIDFDMSATDATVYTYSLDGAADFSTQKLRLNKQNGCYEFDLKTPDGTICGIKMNYPGLVNVENAVGAAALSLLAGATEKEIKEGVFDYKGVARRFDVRFNNGKYIYIDDYAHHPEELKAIITSVKALYQGRKITGIFQPHLYSRTLDFSDAFATSLDLLDSCILLPLYPAREEPIAGVSSEIIFNQMKIDEKFLESKPEALKRLANGDTDVVITMGAGDIDSLAADIIEILKSKN